MFQPLQAYCLLWEAKPVKFWFSIPSMEVQDFHIRPRALPCSHFGLTPLSHIGKRCAPLMAYKPLEQPLVYHYYAYCPLWGAKPARFWFSVPSMEVQDFHLRSRALPCSHFGLTPLSHIDKRCAPLMGLGQRCAP